MTSAPATSAPATSPSIWAVHAGHLILLATWALAVLVSPLWSRVAKSTPIDRLERSGWVWSAAVSSGLSAGVHLAVVREHFAQSGLYGTFFLALAAAQLGWSAAVLARPHRSTLFAGAAASALVVVLWFATRTIGIPFGPAAGQREAVGAADIAASAAQTCVALSVTFALIRARVRARRSELDGTARTSSKPPAHAART